MPRMTRKRAQSIMERLCNEELQRLAIDANLYDHLGATYAAAVKASKERKDILLAMNVLFGDQRQLTMFEEEK